jgi:hypothetical protein
MSFSHTLNLTLWALVVACETCLMVVLLWRKAWRNNAAFTSFIAFCVLRSGLLLFANMVLKSLPAYLLIWWGAYPPQAVILIALVLEVVQIVFCPYEALPRGTLGNFVFAAIIVILLTIGFTIVFPGDQTSAWTTFFRAMDQGLSWALLSVFLVIIAFSKALGIPWNHRIFGIIVGFVFYLSIDVTIVTLTAQLGFPVVSEMIWYCDRLAFLLACVEWNYCFVRADVPRVVPTIDELNKLATILGKHVLFIKFLEEKRYPGSRLRENPVPRTLQSEGR